MTNDQVEKIYRRRMSAKVVSQGMKNMVSVVIPCFNAGNYLSDAVNSILAQTYTSIEVIIVDDGSTDLDTVRLLESARWPRTRIIRQANSGPAAARNAAIRQAAGQYILPLDADDTIEPTYIEKAVAILDEDQDVACVYCKGMKFGAEAGPWDLPPYRLEELVIDNVVFVSALIRKDDWARVGGFTESLVHGIEDYDFWVKLVGAGRKIVQLDEYLFNYRVQQSSRTSKFKDTHENVVNTYADIFRRNRDFYAEHAETIFRHRFALYSQLETCRETIEQDRIKLQKFDQIVSENQYWRARYGRLEALLTKNPTLTRLLRSFAGVARCVKRVLFAKVH